MISRTRKPVVMLLLAAVAMALVITAAMAAPRAGKGKPGGQKRATHMQRIANELGLTEQQKAQIKGIFEAHRAKVQALKQSNATPEAKRTQRMELMKEMHAQIEGVLTPEQREKAAQIRQQHKGKMKGFAKCLQQLNLTEDQKKQIVSIRQAARQQMQAVRADAKLNDQAKREKIMAIRKDTHEKVMSVLTPEQREKLQSCPRLGDGKGMRGHGRMSPAK